MSTDIAALSLEWLTRSAKKRYSYNFTWLSRPIICVVFDTVIEDLPEDFYPQHPWNVGNNPKTAVWDFLAQNDCFEIDRSIPEKLLITVAPDGFLKRIR